MLRNCLLASAIILGSSTAIAAPVSYTIDPDHTDVLFTWNHFGYSNPTGHLGLASGTIVFDEAKPEASSVEVSFPLTGMDSHVSKLNEHLKGEEFFDAAKFPEITFKSSKVEKAAGTNAFTVTGDLTIHGVTKPVVLAATLNSAEMHPMKKVPAIGFDATTTLKRSDFGVAAYVPKVSDEIKVRITVEAMGSK
ncbi:MAG: YceI family protein [Dokdonella sp.]